MHILQASFIHRAAEIARRVLTAISIGFYSKSEVQRARAQYRYMPPAMRVLRGVSSVLDISSV